MKKAIFSLVLSVGFCTMIQAQENFYGTRNVLIGSVTEPTDASNGQSVEGSAYLYDDWRGGIVNTAADKSYRNINIRYNLLEDEVYFEAGEGAPSVFAQPVKEFVIPNKAGGTHLFRNGFNIIGKYDRNTFFEVLAEGKLILLKKITKRMTDSREYGSAVTNYQWVDVVEYFIYQDEVMVKVKKGSKAFFETLLPNQPAVSLFISEQKTSLKSEAEIIGVINYINTL